MNKLLDLAKAFVTEIENIRKDVDYLLSLHNTTEEPVIEKIKGNFIDLDEISGVKSSNFLMSYDIPDYKKRQVIDYHISQGYNSIYIMPWFYEDYDGAKYPVNFDSYLTHPSGVSLKDHWIHWLLVECRQKVLEPIVCLMTDDKMPFMDRSNIEEVWNRMDDFITTVAEPLQIKHLVIGLEAREYWDDWIIREIGSRLTERCQWAKIGLHTLGGDRSLLTEDFFDIVYYQYSEEERESSDSLVRATQDVIAYSNKEVIATEYTLYGEREEEKRKADELLTIDNCIGVLNGSH